MIRSFLCLALLSILSCGADPSTENLAGVGACLEDSPYAIEVISFEPGTYSGYGDSEMPDVVLGPPLSGPPTSGSLDVVSLGVGGEIILGFGERVIVNGEGPDLIIWENAFWLGGNPETPFAELGEVAVSVDGEEWLSFPCDPLKEEGYDPGCAGWRPRAEFEVCALIPLDPSMTGGDSFDLDDLGIDEVRYVRIRDLSESGASNSAGFDLDAVGAVYLESASQLD